VKPLRLELAGFTCFREPATVSFDDLTLFAISGPTGSGKSTILDALVYALYGRTPRLGATGLGALLNPAADGLYVILEFEAKGGTYRAFRSMRQTKSALQSQVRLEKQTPDASWKALPETGIAEVNAKLEDIVGLDYDSFVRAVMLPQGAFDEFLRGDAAARRRLLVKLVGLERIALMQAEAGKRASEAKARQEFIQKQLDGDYANVTPDRLRVIREERQVLETREGALRTQVESLTQALKDLEEVKGLLDEKARVERRLQELQAQEAKIEADKSRLKQARHAAMVLPLVRAAEEQTQRLVEVKRTLKEQQANVGTLEQRVRQAQAGLAGAQTEAQRIPVIEAQLETLAGAGPLLQKLQSLGGSLALVARAREGASFSEDAWQALQEKRAQLPNLVTAVREMKEVQEAVVRAEAKVTESERDIGKLQASLETLVTQGKEAREAAKQAEQAYVDAANNNRALVLRRHLHAGDACPVCEQNVTMVPPARGDEADLAALEIAKKQADAKVSELLASYKETKARLEGVQHQLEDRKANLRTAQSQREERQRTVEELRRAFASFGTVDPEAISKRLDEERAALLASLAKTVHTMTGGLDPERALTQLKAEKRRLEEAVKSAQEAAQRAQGELERFLVQMQAQQARYNEVAQDAQRASEALSAGLKEAGFTDAAAVRSAYLDDARRSSLEAGIDAFNDQRRLAESEDVKLQAKLAGRTLDEGAYTQQKETLKSTQAELQDIQRRLGALSEQLRILQEGLERTKALREEQQALAKLYDTFYHLSLDLRGTNFQDYLVTRVQQNLAYRASSIMKVSTDGRYDLRLVDGEYQVLDAWHTGEPRKAKTLSGGETFIASLALALALSDTIAGNTVLGALFLDEGFGTLDADTLDSVAGVLEALTEQGRMVGVITHVTSLTERMPDRLIVQKGPEGSRAYWDA
jgi:exonuclease SbcC